MRWLWFALSIVCFAVAFRTHSVGLAVICLLAALGFVLAFTLALASSRIESRGRDASAMMGPDEVRQMRENIERRKRAEAESSPAASGRGSDPIDESTRLDTD
jgi:hypothetical protein